MSGVLRAESLLSPDWYRLASMRPRLRPGIAVSRQRVRGQSWFVLSDPVSGRHHRVNDIAYGLIACCDGRRTLDEVWASRVEREGEDAPTQGEAIRVIIEAFRANLFVGDVVPDAAAVISAHQRERRRRQRAAINPLSFKVPLWDPDAWLARWTPQVAPLFRPGAQAMIWLIIACGALFLAAHATEVFRDAGRALQSARMLLVLWLVFPCVKALHELAHALAVRSLGGEVHEVGVSVLLLTPIPYVDASASTAFDRRRDRIIVAAAGVAVEALLATVGLAAWLALEPGLAREVALALVLIGGVSTVLVNANPLLRFDGYHVLCDALALPNLAGRSQRFWLELLRHRVLGVTGYAAASPSRDERPWLIAYAPLSWLCRMVLIVGLAITLSTVQPTLGLLLLAVGLFQAVALPTGRALLWVGRAEELSGRRSGVAARMGAVLILVGACLIWVPLPDRSHAPAVVWLPDDALVRVGAEGFIEAWLVPDGAEVPTGTPIARLANPQLLADLAETEALIAQREVERAGAFVADPKQTAIAADELMRLTGLRRTQQQRIDALTVRAQTPGRVVIDVGRVRIGQFVPQGELIAHLLTDREPPMVRALVSNEDVATVRELLATRTEADGSPVISIDLATGGPALSARLERAVPLGSTALPTAALGERAGGSIQLLAEDSSGRTAREPRFAFDLRLTRSTDTAVPAVGTRALATFRAGEVSAFTLSVRQVRRLFLRHFER